MASEPFVPLVSVPSNPATDQVATVWAAEKVIKAKRKYSEYVVNLVAAGVDVGPVIGRRRVRVLPGDTKESLFARTQVVEKEELPRVINQFLEQQTVYEIRKAHGLE